MRKLSYLTDNLVPRSPRSSAGLRKWRLRDGPTRRAQEGLLKLPDERHPLKRKENWQKLLLLGTQTGDKLAKPPLFVAYSRLCRHCRNLAEGGCRLAPFRFRLCRYFLGHVACRNLPWQGLRIIYNHTCTHDTHVIMIMIVMMTIKLYKKFYKLEYNTLLSVH